MKKLALQLSLVGFVLTSLFAQSNMSSQFDFNKTKWGMTKAQVKKCESGGKAILIIDSEESLSYLDTIEGKQCLVTYYFIKGKLQKGVYAFIEQHSNSATYLKIFNNLKESLTKKYGLPTTERLHANSTPDEEDHEMQVINTASAKDYDKLTVIWNHNNSRIELVLARINYSPRLLIKYQSKEFEEVRE
ncbi:MAG: hypothetical protein ACE5HX_03205 [bacterium]